MAGQVIEKGTAGNMEHLLKLLHNEWERSGRTKVQLSLRPEDVEEIGTRIAGEIQERQSQLEMEGMTFEQGMELSKENFILLRLAKKIKKAGDKAGRSVSVLVELDKEEYRLFFVLIKIRETE